MTHDHLRAQVQQRQRQRTKAIADEEISRSLAQAFEANQLIETLSAARNTATNPIRVSLMTHVIVYRSC